MTLFKWTYDHCIYHEYHAVYEIDRAFRNERKDRPTLIAKNFLECDHYFLLGLFDLIKIVILNPLQNMI